MKNNLIFSIILLMTSYAYLSGQGNSYYRNSVLYRSNDSVLRCAVVDSIVNESFWDTDAKRIPYYRSLYRKTDFSESSKETLLSYFNRSLNDFEIQKIIDDAKKTMEFDIEKIKKESEQKYISYDSLYMIKLNELVNRNTKIVSARAKSWVSPYYAYLLGWLDYKPAIPVLEAIIKDSLVTNKGYAVDNREKLETSCKLALARMGNKQYQKELLADYKKVEISCNNPRYTDFLQNLYYINNKECINYVIQLSEDDKIQTQPYMYGLVHECSPQGIILIYLSKVINDYPLKFEYEETKEITMEYPQGLSLDPFYKNQFVILSNWLKKNRETYKINTEKLFMPSDF